MLVPAVPLEPLLQERMAMTVSRCFAFCSAKRGMGFFAIAEGSKCWCGAIYEGTNAEAPKCSAACSGDDTPGCGGPKGASGTYADVYIMFDCTESTEEEKELIVQEKHEDTMSAYSSFPDQTCGQAVENKVEVGREGPASTYIGTVEECKSLCMWSKGSEGCHGFTYHKALQRCTFHPDVLDGPAEKTDSAECYFKKIGLLQALSANHSSARDLRWCRTFSPASSEAR